MNNKLNAVVVLSLLALAESTMAQSAGQCADLTRFQIPGTPLVITGAEIVPATDNLPSHCRVDGMINERTGADGRTYGIGFGLALPEDWNGRFLFQGGGGYNGMVRPPRGVAAVGDRLGLARGFAVATTDSGHKGDVFDTSFNVDQQASLDFAQIAVARVTELAKQIVAHHYGESASYSYFTGCSTGGREAMLMTQRYPTFFDGVVSGNPAMRTSVSRLGNLWRRTVFNAAAPKDPDGRPEPHKLFSESDRQLLLDGVLAACDANDGLEDEMIFDTRSCNFDPAELACEGAKTDSCLAPAQVDALEKAFPGPRNSRGDLVYPMSLEDAGLAALLPSSAAPEPGSPVPQTSVNIDAELFALVGDPLAALTDTVWTNLSTFADNGGKLLFYHGMSDPAFAAMDTLDYYLRMAEDSGGLDRTRDWSRFYLVPGMLHCRGGDYALDQFDLLSAVIDWVENDKTPNSVVATGGAFPGRSRPLCAYPEYAHYTGQGDPEDASNFVCRE